MDASCAACPNTWSPLPAFAASRFRTQSCSLAQPASPVAPAPRTSSANWNRALYSCPAASSKPAENGQSRLWTWRVLRRRAPAGFSFEQVVNSNSRSPAALRGHDWWRSGHHGSSQSRCKRGWSEDSGTEYRSAVRADAQSLHHSVAEFRVSLLLHAQVLVRVSLQGTGDLPWRLRNHG